MAKLELNDVVGGFGAVDALNDNFERIETAIENTLSRNGLSPNSMGATLDMNSNRIINLPAPQNNSDAARWVDVTNGVELTGTPVPSQVGNNRKMLTTNGTNVQWTDRDVVTTKQFGAVGGGVVDDSAAIQAALNSGAPCVILNTASRINTTLTIPFGTTLEGDGLQYLIKGANIDMVDMSASACRLVNVHLEGNGATYTGRGIVMSNGANGDQEIIDCEAVGMSGPCFEITAASAGSRMVLNGGVWQRQNAANPAIVLPTESFAQGTRYFMNLMAGGGLLFEPNGSNMVQVVNCNLTGITFPSTGKIWTFTNCRIASHVDTAGNGLQIINCALGGNIIARSACTTLIVDGCNVAGNLQLEAGASGVRVGDSNFIQGGVADNSNVGAANRLYYSGSFTPVWGSDGSAPSIGNGAINGRLVRSGNMLRIMINLVFGSTTSAGTGSLWFTLPSPFNSLNAAGGGAVTQLGDARLVDSGTAAYSALSRVNSNPIKIYVTTHNAVSDVNATVPFTLTNTDVIQVDIEVELA